MSRNKIEPLPDITPAAEPSLDNIADPDVAAAIESDRRQHAGGLSESEVLLESQVAEQEQSLRELEQRQRLIEQRQHAALQEDEMAQRQRLQHIFSEIEQQMDALRVLQQQQEQVLHVLSIQEKVAEQEKQIRAFNEYQNAFLRSMQAPMQANSTGVQTLQANQKYLISALGSINMHQPRAVPKSGVLDYQIPSTRLPELQQRQQQLVAGDPSKAGTARFTNEPIRLGGLRPYPNQDPDIDAKRLRKAMKGLGTDEKTLLTIIGTRNNYQRTAIAQAYCTNYKRDLFKDVKSETSGNFRNLLLALLMPPERFDAIAVNKAIKGLGTDDSTLIELLCTRTNQQVVAMKHEYQQVFSRDMIGDIKADTSGNYQKLLVALAAGDRDESMHVELLQAKEDALALHKAGEDRRGTDEQVFIDILTKRNFCQLRAIFEAYSKLDEYDIEATISRETSFNFKKALLMLIRAARSRIDVFADLLHQSMKGLGTHDEALIRIIVSRSEIDIRDISKAFGEKYKHTLEQMVRSETSGDYRKLLLELLYCERDFDPAVEAKRLFKAIKGWGCDKATVNKVISVRSSEQRQIVRDTYDSMYKRVLIKDLESELSGDHRALTLALMMPKAEFAAREVRRAVEGLGTDDSALIEVLCSRTAVEMKELKEAYQEIFSRDLAGDIKADTSGDYQQLLVALVEAERDDQEPVDPDKAVDEAARLYAAGEAKVGTNESVFIEILTTHGWQQLKAIFDQYDKICDYDIAKSIKRETSFNFKKALLSIVEVVKDPCDYFAERLDKAMKGLGTNERALTRVIVLREEIDLKEIIDAYFAKFKRSLDSAVGSETSRHYRKLLLRLFDHARKSYRNRPDQHAIATTSLEVGQGVVGLPPGDLSRMLMLESRGRSNTAAAVKKDAEAGYVQIADQQAESAL